MVQNKIEECPICYGNDSNIITNCKHQFCNGCIIILHKRDSDMKCPICRREIKELKHIIVI